MLLLSYEHLYLGHLLIAWLHEGVESVWFVLGFGVSFVFICTLTSSNHFGVVICEDCSVVHIFGSRAFTAQNEVRVGLYTAFSEIGLP